MYRSFFDELTKISARGYKAPLLAHELGHAQSHEAINPTLRKAIEIGAPIAGLGGAIYGAVKGRPLVTGLSILGSQAPRLAEEAAASIMGYKALKERGASEKELKKARRLLMKAWGTYGSQAAGLALGGGAGVALGKAGIRANSPLLAQFGPQVGTIGGLTAGLLGTRALYKSMRKDERGVSTLTPEEAEALRSHMKVKAKIYEGKKGAPETYWAAKPLLRGLQQKMLEKHLKNPKQAKEILERSGVLLPAKGKD